jgi:hypothetical protein
MALPQHLHWIAAIRAELDSLKKLNTYKLIKLPKGRKAIDSKWVLTLKRDGNSNIICYKVRLVAQSYTQCKGTDFHEIFAPVA